MFEAAITESENGGQEIDVLKTAKGQPSAGPLVEFSRLLPTGAHRDAGSRCGTSVLWREQASHSQPQTSHRSGCPVNGRIVLQLSQRIFMALVPTSGGWCTQPQAIFAVGLAF